MRWNAASLVLPALFLLIAITGRCNAQEDNEVELPPPEVAFFFGGGEKKDGVPTYVSPLEKLAKTFLVIPERIGKGIMDILPDIPFLKNGKGESPVKTIGDILGPIKDKIRAIYPGTYWCGDGDIANNDEELGFFKQTDACCREHDSCKEGIAPREVQHNLRNTGIFTRSHCNCDEKFYRCLKEAQNIIATKIGVTYFNILQPQCFREEYPIVNCKTYAKEGLIHDTCVEYNLNKTASPKYQWFDNQNFI